MKTLLAGLIIFATLPIFASPNQPLPHVCVVEEGTTFEYYGLFIEEDRDNNVTVQVKALDRYLNVIVEASLLFFGSEKIEAKVLPQPRHLEINFDFDGPGQILVNTSALADSKVLMYGKKARLNCYTKSEFIQSTQLE